MQKKEFFYVFVIIALLFMNYYSMNKINNMSEKFDTYENTINALNDSVSLSVKNGINNWSQKTPEIDIDDLINSEFYKTLSAEQQQYYKELSKIKGLISSTQAELSKQGELLAQIKEGQNPGVVSNDSISFKLGTTLPFSETDTSKNLQWNAFVTLDKAIDFKFDYKYDIKIQTTYERQKDKSILVKYKIDDPELKVNSMYNYTIPIEERRTKVGKWYDKNKRVFQFVGGSILFVGGGYLGYTLAK